MEKSIWSGLLCLLLLGGVGCRRSSQVTLILFPGLPDSAAVDLWDCVSGEPVDLGGAPQEMHRFRIPSDSLLLMRGAAGDNDPFRQNLQLGDSASDPGLFARWKSRLLQTPDKCMDSMYLVDAQIAGRRAAIPSAIKNFAAASLRILDPIPDTLTPDDYEYRLLLGARLNGGPRPHRVWDGKYRDPAPVRLLKIQAKQGKYRVAYSEYWPLQMRVVRLLDQPIDRPRFERMRRLLDRYQGGVFVNKWRTPEGGNPYGSREPRDRLGVPDSIYFNYSAVAERVDWGIHRISYGTVGSYCKEDCGSIIGGLSFLLPGMRTQLEPLLKSRLERLAPQLAIDLPEAAKFWKDSEFWWYSWTFLINNLQECIY